MTSYEFRKRYIRNPRKTGAIHKGDKETIIEQEYNAAIQAIRNLQIFNIAPLFEGPVRVRIEVYGKSSADADNILKGIGDALNRFAYDDDRQIKESAIKFC